MRRLWLDMDSAVEFTGMTPEEIVKALNAGDLRSRREPGVGRKFDAADLVAKFPPAAEAAQAIGKALGIVRE